MYCVFLVCLTRTSYICKFAATVDEVTGNASHMAWVVSTLILGSAFIAREAMQIAAARKIGTTSAYFLSFWNFVDLASASLAIATIASFLASGPGETFNHLASVTAFFMWLKLLGLIKALNKQVATCVREQSERKRRRCWRSRHRERCERVPYDKPEIGLLLRASKAGANEAG